VVLGCGRNGWSARRGCRLGLRLRRTFWGVRVRGRGGEVRWMGEVRG
jgi:hypothetical protein